MGSRSVVDLCASYRETGRTAKSSQETTNRVSAVRFSQLDRRAAWDAEAERRDTKRGLSGRIRVQRLSATHRSYKVLGLSAERKSSNGRFSAHRARLAGHQPYNH
jgi:hypothetical protein